MKAIDFKKLDLSAQIDMILTKGSFYTFSANESEGKSLYRLLDFYVEVRHSSTANPCQILILDKPSQLFE